MERSSDAAFQGNPLQKSNTKSSSKRQIRSSTAKVHGSSTTANSTTTERWFDIDQMWRGSISNLKSSENITEDLIKESIRDLEQAMGESKKMLQERDAEIARLRLFIDNNELGGRRGRSQEEEKEKEREEEVRHTELLAQLHETEKRNSSLEKQIHKLELDHSREIHDLKMQHNQTPAIWNLDTPDSRPECTCYCGTVCKALNDLVDSREQLEITKSKYEGLKKRVREFRRQTELQQKNQSLRQLSRDDERMTNCSIQ